MAATSSQADVARRRDYSLLGEDAKRAQELGLVAARWYHTDLPRKRMKELLRRKDGPALRHTALWFGLLAAFGVGGGVFWGSWVCVPFFVCYGVLYGTASDSRWHEFGHRTAFKTRWLNDVMYQVSSFMVMKEATFWRWSHARHHSDTLIVGRDREIAAMRPADVVAVSLNLFNLRDLVSYFPSLIRHALGRLKDDEVDLVPEPERARVYWEARATIVVYIVTITAAIVLHSFLPLMYIGLPSLYGAWLKHLFGLTQHAGLAEDVLDHRLNSRTVMMNPVFRYLYLNMNYHVEHHMFPMVPYHALPALHEEIKEDLPAPMPSMLAAYREIIPAVWRQLRDHEYFIRKELPAGAAPFRPEMHDVVLEDEPRRSGSKGAE